jgi:hypothetical protein
MMAAPPMTAKRATVRHIRFDLHARMFVAGQKLKARFTPRALRDEARATDRSPGPNLALAPHATCTDVCSRHIAASGGW